MSGPTVGALFAGYGGVELALHRVWPGARPLWFSQYDPDGGKRQAPSRILAHHWPDVPNHGDVTAIDWATVEPVDILTAGFPCQDVSTAGKRKGLVKGVTRSGLWGATATAIEALHPRLVVIENVRGLLSAKADGDVEQCAWCVGGAADGEPSLRALGAVLGDLADIGYDAAWVGLRAADVGAPHGRFRVFVLAWPQSDPGALNWPQSDPGALLATPSASQGAALRTSPSDYSDLGRQIALLPTPAVNDMGASYTPDEWDDWTARMQAAHGNGNGHGASLHVEALRLLPTPRSSDTNGAGEHGAGGMDLRTAIDLLPTPRATDGTNGGPNQRGSSGDLMLPGAVSALSSDPRRNDAHPASLDAGQGVPGVRRDVQPEAVQGSAREQPALPLAGLLLPELREHEAERQEGHGSLASAEAPGVSVHGVLGNDGPARAPHRPESDEQRPGEPHHPVRVVPPAPALAGGPRCPYGCGATCGGHSAAPWGAYEAAIRRWEVLLGRPAPDATEPTGRGGAHRLSPALVEFLMGLPEGWVTGVPGITRNDMLKALGNGVVPQQCAEAVRWLLEVRAGATKAVAS